MKRLLISGFVAVALLAVATTLRSYSISEDRSAMTMGMASLKISGCHDTSGRGVRGHVAGVLDTGETLEHTRRPVLFSAAAQTLTMPDK
ncbi:hypothetical protein ACFIOY_31210 [Bradyrhizobium sp. TZ2]